MSTMRSVTLLNSTAFCSALGGAPMTVMFTWGIGILLVVAIFLCLFREPILAVRATFRQFIMISMILQHQKYRPGSSASIGVTAIFENIQALIEFAEARSIARA